MKKFSNWDTGNTATWGNVSCYNTHPGLTFVAKNGKEYTIYGGNCSSPIVHDADIYIGFAYGVSNPSKAYPWEKNYRPVTVINYPITDMKAPDNAASFKAMIDWVCNQLQSGKKIHAGCIGGHGRTGMFLSAVVAQMAGMKDAIQYVRTHYCKKAVETSVQVKFLMEHYGVSKAEDIKKYTTTPTKSTESYYPALGKVNGYQGSSGTSEGSSGRFKGSKRNIKPVLSPKSIW